MVVISQMVYSGAFWYMKIFYILTEISLKFVPKGPINNTPALVQVMAWHRSGAKPLSEPMRTRFTDAYMRREGGGGGGGGGRRGELNTVHSKYIVMCSLNN